MLKKCSIVLLILSILLLMASCGQKEIQEININDYLSIEITGSNGWGEAQIVGVSDFENALLKLRGDDATIISVAMIQNEIEYSLDKTERLSNGDIVTLNISVDNEQLEKEYGIRVIYTNEQKTVGELVNKKYIELNPFEYYGYDIEGESPYLTVTLKNQSDFGIGGKFVIEYPHENIPFLQNGDTAIVRFEYDERLAEEQSIKVLDGYKTIEAGEHPNNAKRTEEISENTWNQLLAYANNVAENAVTESFVIDSNTRYQTHDMADDINLQYMGNFFFVPIVSETSTTLPKYNACFFIYKFNALNLESNMIETCYLIVTVDNVKTGEVEIAEEDVLFYEYFNEWNKLYGQCVRANKQQFVCEENIIK